MYLFSFCYRPPSTLDLVHIILFCTCSVVSPKLQYCQNSTLCGWGNDGDIYRNLKVEGNKDWDKC